MLGLSNNNKIVAIGQMVWPQSTRVTDRQTDGRCWYDEPSGGPKNWKLKVMPLALCPDRDDFLQTAGHKCVPNVPFRDTGTSRSKPGLSRSNRDVWLAWARDQYSEHKNQDSDVS